MNAHNRGSLMVDNRHGIFLTLQVCLTALQPYGSQPDQICRSRMKQTAAVTPTLHRPAASWTCPISAGKLQVLIYTDALWSLDAQAQLMYPGIDELSPPYTWECEMVHLTLIIQATTLRRLGIVAQRSLTR